MTTAPSDPSASDLFGMARTMKTVSRRKWLCQRVPPCINCGEARQIQLEGWRWIPANWRCRKCGNGWDHEPDSDSLPNDSAQTGAEHNSQSHVKSS